MFIYVYVIDAALVSKLVICHRTSFSELGDMATLISVPD